LKSVAGLGFARLSTGAPITRGNSANGVLLIRENRAARKQKSQNGKTRFGASHPQGRSTSQLYGLFTTTCGAGLLTSSCANFLDLARLLVETRSKLPNPCAEVRCCSWSQREGRVSDRKTGMSCKRVVDHKIPVLASSLAQGRRGTSSFGEVPPQVKRTVHPGTLIVPTGISSRFAATEYRPGRKVRVVGFATLVARFVNQGLSPSWDIL
jgi:hypothetical protein